MNDNAPSMFFTNSTVLARLYGQSSSDECLLDVILDDDGKATIMIRCRIPKREPVIILPAGSHVLVQLFEQPEVLWLSHATCLNGAIFICFEPIEALVSADGRSTPPKLADVTLEQVNEAVTDAMDSRDRTKGGDTTL